MTPPDTPDNENLRLLALHELRLLDTEAEERFDRLTRIAQRHFNTPIALITLIDANRQWFKSRQGVDTRETPRDISFCGHAILNDGILNIPDALNDPRFRDNPLVLGPPNIRFYAGAPLVSPGDFRFGTLCIIDTRPRTLEPEQLETLRDLADAAQKELWSGTQLTEKMAEKAIYLQSVVDTVLDPIISIDRSGIITMCNPATEKLFGYSIIELKGKNVSILMPESYAGRHDQYLRHFIQTGEKRVIGIGRQVEGKHKNGKTFPIQLAVTEVRGKDFHEFVGVIKDLSYVEQQERFLDAVIENLPGMIFVKDARDLRFTLFNKAGENLLGKSRFDIVGKTDYDLLAPDEAHSIVEKDLDILQSHAGSNVCEETITTPTGEKILLTRRVTIRDSSGEPQYLLGISEDVTEKKALEHELELLARNDVLTGLANRRAFGEYLANEISRCKRTAEKLLCFFIDLNDFKPINDTLGHDSGDAVLIEIARRLKNQAREFDCVARLGGDEFTLVLSRVENHDQVSLIRQRIKHLIQQVISLESGDLIISASIGHALYPDDADTANDLLKVADNRMYDDKKLKHS